MSRLGLVSRGRSSSLREVVRRPGAPHFVQLNGLVFRGDPRLEFVSIDSMVAGAGHLMSDGTGCSAALGGGGSGLARLRRDASAARGSPGRFAAVARGRRCLWSQMGARRCPGHTTLAGSLRALASRPWRRATPRGAEKNELNLPPYSPCNASSTRRAALKTRAYSARAAHGTRKNGALARRGSSHTARAARGRQHIGAASQAERAAI